MPRIVAFLQALITALLALYLYSLLKRPDLLIVGSFTHDLVGSSGTTRPGGAVSYAAVAARALGIRACVLTVAGPEVDKELSLFQGHELHVVRGPNTLTFQHTYDWKGNRQLRVVSDPKLTLRRSHLPWHCRRARVVLLGPLTPDDVDTASFMEHDSWVDLLLRGPQLVGIIGQGYQRHTDAAGRVQALSHPAPQLLERHGKRTSLFLSDVETLGWSAEQLGMVAAQHGRMLVTQGRHGAQEWNTSGVFQISAVQVPQVDTNGAGDTFATGYMVALAQGHPDPGHAAAWTASRAVMAPQSCKPGCAGEALKGHRIDGIKAQGDHGGDGALMEVASPGAPASPSGGAPANLSTSSLICGASGSSSFHCRPWSTLEKLWVDVVGLWPHVYAVLYDALVQHHLHGGAKSGMDGLGGGGSGGGGEGSCSNTGGPHEVCAAHQPGLSSLGARPRGAHGKSTGEGHGVAGGLGRADSQQWSNSSIYQPSYLQAMCRWASSACNRMQSMHEQLCGVREGSIWDGEDKLLGVRHTSVQSSITGLYCGLVGGVKQAAVWALQVGVCVAARLGMAVDEVARQ